MRSQRLRSRTAHSAPQPGSGVSIGNVAIRIAVPGARAPSRRAALLGSVCIGALAMLGPGTAHAVNGTWTGATTNEWTTGTNWNSVPPNTVPDGVGTATFTNNGAPTSVTISGTPSINTIAFDTLAPAFSFTVQNGATFTFTTNGGTSNNSSFLPTFTVNTGATMTLGNGVFVEVESLAGGGNVVVGPSAASTNLTVGGNTSSTFSGTLSGAGTLEIDGGAVLTLTGQGSTIGAIDLCNCDANGGLTISGGSLTVTDPSPGGSTVVEGGTLSVINGGTLQTPSLAVVFSSAMIIDGAGSTVTVSPSGLTEFASIGGPVSVTISNGGVLNSLGLAAIDAQDPTFTPTVTVTGRGSTWNVGSLAVGGSGTFGGPGILTISNGGVVNATGPLGVGDPTGTSMLTVTGTGSALNAGNSLSVGDPCDCLVGTLTVADGGVVNSPGFTGVGKGSTLNLGIGGLAGAIVTPAIDNHGQIVANFTDTLTLAAAISGPGELRKAGVGTLILTGDNTYRGSTTVDGGTLSVNGSIVNSALTVNAGGTIGGNGIIGNTTINGGTLAPGNSIGTLTVQGNLVMTSAAAYIVEVSPTNADRTNVTGTATLGGTVQAVFAPGAYISRSYTILSATGGRIGTFGSLTTPGLPAGFTAGLSYTATDTILNLFAHLAVLPNDIGTGGLSINQRNVATALDNFFNNGGALPPGFLPIFGLTGSNLGNALSQLSGEAATGGQQVGFQMGNQFLGMMLDPFVDGRNGAAGLGGPAIAFAPEREAVPDEVALAYAAVLKAPAVKAPSFEQRWSAWGGAYGGSNRTSGDPAVVGSHDLSARTAGFAGGLDYRVTPNTVVGVALAGGGTNWSLANGLGGGKSDAFQAGVYGVTRSGPAYLAAAFAFTNHWMSTDRFAFAGDHLTASFNAQSLGARVESGYRFATMFGGIAPYAAIQAQSFRTPTYSETDVNGGGFALGYNGRTATDTRSELGARFDRLLALNPTAALALRARLAWAHDWVSDPALGAVFQALPGASFIVNGAAPAKNSALASAGTELRLANGVTLIGKFDGEFASRSSTYAGTGTIRYSW
jgi:autotransporter-associated beta strand protein/T5SS/PEP-CTERM-associated repeat protein